jgi:outer membrane protein TolC
MSELLKFIQEADVAALDMERAKAAVEAAKLSLEAAKENLESARKAFDEVLLRADDLGIPRPKVRKLIEERTASLLASGLVPAGNSAEAPSPKPAAKAPKAAKVSKKAKGTTSDVADTSADDADLEADLADGDEDFRRDYDASSNMSLS